MQEAQQVPLWLQQFPNAAREPKKELKFSRNWNGKLNTEFFTTVRLASNYWQQGEYYRIMHDGFCFRGLILKKSSLLLNDIPEYTAYLDAGMPVAKFKEMIYRMYQDKVKDWNRQLLDVLLIQNIQFVH